MLKSMAERYPRPDWVRRMNAMGDSVGGAERMVSLDVDELASRHLHSLGSRAIRRQEFSALLAEHAAAGVPDHW